MARGDQRDRDRAKAQAKLAKKGGAGKSDGHPAQRNANDSVALAEKVAKKAAMKKEADEKAAKEGSTKIVERKKVKKKEEGLDDLLSAGLAGGKGKKKGKK